MLAVGISVSRWITMHGFSINVSPNLGDFGRIVPCGIADRGVTSLQKLLPPGALPSLAEVQARTRDAVADVFQLRMVRARQPVRESVRANHDIDRMRT